MRPLADFEGGSWPPVGWHVATITACEMTESPVKCTPGVQFTFQVGDKLPTRTFWLTEKALVFLGHLAVACGLTENERRRYDVDNHQHHRGLINRRLQIRIAKQAPENVYHEIAEFAAVGENVSDKPTDPRVDRSAESADVPTSQLKDIPF